MAGTDSQTTDDSIYPSGTTTKNLSTAQFGMQNPYAATVLGRGMALASSPYQAFRLPGGEGQADSARVANVNPWMNQAMGLTSLGATGMYGAQQAQRYMDPYMQQVVDQQKQQAMQDYARQQPAQQAASFQAGAGRGTRSALLQAEGQRNLQNQLQGIQAQGLQNAWQQGQQQYNADMQRYLQGAGQIFSQGQNLRQAKQDELSAMYEDFLKEQQYPQEQNKAMMALLAQMPQYQDYSMTSQTTPPPVNQAGQTMGGILDLIRGATAGGGDSSGDGSSSGGLGDLLSKGWNAVTGWFGGNSNSPATTTYAGDTTRYDQDNTAYNQYGESVDG